MRRSEFETLDPMFIERWSPRAFKEQAVDEKTMATLFEAARWSPSCFNEQPWRFVVATTESQRANFLTAVADGNRPWASKAPVLVFVFAKKSFTQNGNPNRWAEFDSGAAWMSLSLQAHKLGLVCHAMGGFDAAKATELSGLDSSEYGAICAVAIGHQGSADQLPDPLKEREQPSDRRPLDEIVIPLP